MSDLSYRGAAADRYLGSYQFDADLERAEAAFSESLSMSELTTAADQQYAHGLGADRPDCAWVLSDRDVWYRNPSYRAPEYALATTHAIGTPSDEPGRSHCAGPFFSWMVYRVNAAGATTSPATSQNHANVLDAWRELRYLQELDAVMAAQHPEDVCCDESADEYDARLQAEANARVQAAWSPAPAPAARPTPAAGAVDYDDDIPF